MPISAPRLAVSGASAPSNSREYSAGSQSPPKSTTPAGSRCSSGTAAKVMVVGHKVPAST